MGKNPVNQTLAAQAAALTVGGLFERQSRHGGNRIALEDDNHCYLYAKLNERVNRLGNALTASGVKHGDRVAILSENRIEYVELQLAAAKIGAIVAALNWRMTAGELEYCIGLVEPRVVLVSPRYRDTLEALPHDAEHLVCLGDDYELWLTNASAADPPDVSGPEDGLIILFTSGTTGLPKAALISHRAMIARGQIFAIDHPIDTDDSYAAWAPLFHMASTDMVLPALMNGGKVIIVDGFNVERLTEIVGRERLSWLLLMPGTIEPFIACMEQTRTQPCGVRRVGSMADLVPMRQIAAVTWLLQAPYMNTFGSTETGMPPATRSVIEVGEKPDGLAKRQNSYCQVRLVDESDRDVADGDAGEMLFRGPSLFSGYWNAPEPNAEGFRGGWFHMGDVFVRKPDGTLDFVDRSKYLIKSGGENIYPAEIERLLLTDARIREAVVVRKPDPHWGEVPVAFVVARTELTKNDVIACCSGRIAAYKLPKQVRLISESDLSRSATGKIKRHELEALLQDES